MTRKGLVCAHRGASLHLPDNSMEAFAAAIAAGADVIETDVRRAPDGRLVLAHDPWDIVEGVVELAALVDLARGRIGLDLEIVERGLERELLDVVDGFHDWLIVTSIYPDVLREVHRLTTHIDTGLVVEATVDGVVGGPPFLGDPFALAEECGAYVTLVEDELATPALIEQARRHKAPLWVWTVNDEARMGELLADPAVTGVITDDPARAVALRDVAPPTVPWPVTPDLQFEIT